MEAPETRYALRDGQHIGYQVWGDEALDILEFNNGLMISIDDTSDEPSWLRYEESLASFSRLIRFDALGLGRTVRATPEPQAPYRRVGEHGEVLAILDRTQKRLGGVPSHAAALVHLEARAALVVAAIEILDCGESELYRGVPYCIEDFPSDARLFNPKSAIRAMMLGRA